MAKIISRVTTRYILTGLNLSLFRGSSGQIQIISVCSGGMRLLLHGLAIVYRLANLLSLPNYSVYPCTLLELEFG